MTARIEIARTLDEVEALEPLWRSVPWTGEQAELPLYLAAGRARSQHGNPLALIVVRDEAASAAAVGRVERRKLETRIGYLDVYAPMLEVLQIVPGGVVAEDSEAIAALTAAVQAALAAGEADALALPALPVDSELYRAFAGLGGALQRQPFIPTWTRRRLVLPESFDEFLASRSRKIRAGIRYDAKKLVDALGDALSVEIFREAGSFERLVSDMDRISASTYQRALGAGFADTAERRAVLHVALEHGWSRAYLLYHRDEPIAYWLCSVHGDAITLGSTGYRPEYARYRVGIYLLMRVIEDACSDPALRVLDFGPGRSAYKRHFSSEGYEERNLVLFAPSFRARRINAARSAILGSAWLARAALDAIGLTDRLKSTWRNRLRRSGA